MAKAVVFIDGNNFYFRLKDLSAQIDGKYSLLEFNFLEFAKWVIGNNELIQKVIFTSNAFINL